MKNLLPGHRIALRSAYIAVLLCLASSLSSCSLSSNSPVNPNSSSSSVIHVVKPGETLWQIGGLYQVSHQRIAQANNIEDPRQLAVGDRLIIPGVRLRPGQQTAQLHHFQPLNSGSLRQYQSKGARLRFPLETGHIVTDFGPNGSRFHDGIDIASPKGTEIHAAHGGVVAYSGDEISGYGNLLIIKNDIGIMTIYAHSSRVFVSSGDRVKRGDVVAEVGSTGRSSGPHLHFEVRMRDPKEHYVAVDPMPFFEAGSTLRPRYRVNESLTPLVSKILD